MCFRSFPTLILGPKRNIANIYRTYLLKHRLKLFATATTTVTIFKIYVSEKPGLKLNNG